MRYPVVFVVILFCFRSSTARICSEKVKESVGLSAKCSDQLMILCARNDLVLTLWDASSRILHTSLTSSGNKDVGDFDLCMSVDVEVDNTTIIGKYCLYEWTTVIDQKTLQNIVATGELLQSIGVNKKSLNRNVSQDQDENLILLGSVCIPDACTPEEFVKVFNPYLYPVMHREGRECITKYSRRDLTTFDVATITCLLIIVAIVLICTIYHAILYYTGRSEPSELVLAFSAVYNGKKLISISNNKVDQIQSMNGMRFLSMVWIIEGHGFAAFKSLDFLNQKVVDEFRKKLYSQYIQGAHMAVDTFFFLSAFLLAYGHLRQAKNMRLSEQIKAVPLLYLHRYLRLTPALAAMFFFTISGFRLIGNGPLWFGTIDTVYKPCRKYWWRFFLYIQNYSPTELCWTQTWYLSADMQMFMLAPVVLIPSAILYRRHMKRVILSLAALAALCVGISIAVLYLVDDYENDYDTHSRLSNYLVGIIGGILFFRNKGKHIKIHKMVNLGLWILSISNMLFIIIYMNDVTENATKLKTALFFPVSRPVWSLCIMWMTFSCYFGYGGIINDFLSNPVFQIGARLTYSMYIVHGLVELYVAGNIRTIQYFDNFVTYYLTCGHVITTIIVAVFWTLLFESPVITLDKMLFRWIDSLRKEGSTREIF